jgi:hypothetical protein
MLLRILLIPACLLVAPIAIVLILLFDSVGVPTMCANVSMPVCRQWRKPGEVQAAMGPGGRGVPEVQVHECLRPCHEPFGQGLQLQRQ